MHLTQHLMRNHLFVRVLHVYVMLGHCWLKMIRSLGHFLVVQGYCTVDKGYYSLQHHEKKRAGI